VALLLQVYSLAASWAPEPNCSALHIFMVKTRAPAALPPAPCMVAANSSNATVCLLNQASSFEEAQASCNVLGGNLAYYTSLQEQVWLMCTCTPVLARRWHNTGNHTCCISSMPTSCTRPALQAAARDLQQSAA
jgi:hypothetical protein